jgi:integrase/recombinase XerD
MTSDELPTNTPPPPPVFPHAHGGFRRLSDVPTEVEWFANLSNPSTRRAYETAVKDFIPFDPHDFCELLWTDVFHQF